MVIPIMVPEIDLYPLVEEHIQKLTSVVLSPELMVSHYERWCLGALLLKYNRGRELCEWGTWQGLTVSYLSLLLPEKKMWTIDCPLDLRANVDSLNPLQPSETLSRDEIGNYFKNKNQNIHQIFIDSINFNIAQSDIKALDFAFIDGNHSIKYVQHDCRQALSKLVVGGILALHNYRNDYNGMDYNLGQSVADGPCHFVHTNLYLNWQYVKDTDIVFCQI